MGQKFRLSAAILGMALAVSTAASAAAPPPARPKLIVALSVDQFALSLFQRYQPTFTGGLKRLAPPVGAP